MSEYKINGITCRTAFTVSRRPRSSYYEFADMTLEVELITETPEHLFDRKTLMLSGLAGTYCYKPHQLSFTTDVSQMLRDLCEELGIPIAAGSRGDLCDSAEPGFQFIIWGEFQRQEQVAKESAEKR